MTLGDPKHPIWEILRLAVISAVLLTVLWRNASNFDATEWKAFGEFVAVYVGLLYGEGRLRRWMNGNRNDG